MGQMPLGKVSSIGSEWYRVPVVFKEGLLVGWGRCFLRNLSPVYDSRFYEMDWQEYLKKLEPETINIR